MMHPIPSTMLSPRDPRPGWTVLQIHVTRACDQACIGCTQGSQLAGKPVVMTPEQFEEALRSLMIGKRWYFGTVGVFGGNPCVHPEFEKLCHLMQRWVPREQRGLWSNNLMGYGKLCRETFNPERSNLNVHLNEAAYWEIRRDWPEAHPKGLEDDSRHSPPYVAMQDMEDMTDEQRWNLIGDCDVNQRWSALIGVFRGELRGYFCELAGAQAMLHEAEPSYPDLGHRITPGWWDKPMESFQAQVRYHCFACGHPLRGHGDWATNGTTEQVSKTHANIFKLKKPKGKTIQLVTKRSELGGGVTAATQYLPTEPE